MYVPTKVAKVILTLSLLDFPRDKPTTLLSNIIGILSHNNDGSLGKYLIKADYV